MFSKLVGNEDIKQRLRRQIAAGRVPNSLLFAGDEGVGKRQFAFELARSFVCTDPQQGESCGVCAPCRRVAVFAMPKPDAKEEHKKVILSEHPDVGMVISYNRNILVDAVRDLEREANFRPYEAKVRIFVVDNADKMNDSASNALLKTLEEPPPTSFIFLISSRPDSLLPTIRSRCQTLRFAPVATNEIEDFLIKERAFSHDEARLAAKLSRGSIGRAVSINVEKVRSSRERMLSVLKNAIQTRNRFALLKASEEMNDAKNKDAFEENLDILESITHDVWTLRTTGDESRLINADLITDLASLARDGAFADLPDWLGSIETMRADLIVNINKRMATDALFATMSLH